MMRKIFKNIAMICLALCVAIGSFFVSVTKKQSNYYASADSTIVNYSFTGSNIYLPVQRINTSSDNSYYDYIIIRNSFSISSGSITFDISGSQSFVIDNINNSNFIGSLLYNNLDTSGNYSTSFSYSINSIVDNFRGRTLYAVNSILPCQYSYWIYCSSLDFTAEISSIELGHSYFDLNSINTLCNFIRYYDVNGNFLTFAFPLFSNHEPKALDNRVYYIDTTLTDNQIYQQGYNQGLADNQSNIYNNAYNAGYEIGFDRGKVQGGAEANNYSFLGLIGAVVDAPVSILSSLFNFTFLGINLWSFITSLLTIALILFVVKIFMRR